jgi:hypothetical protein
MFFVTFIKSIKIFRTPTRPPLSLREAPPLSPSPFPMVFTPPSVPPFPGEPKPQGTGDVTAPPRRSEPLRSKVGGPKRSSPCYAGWDRLAKGG